MNIHQVLVYISIIKDYRSIGTASGLIGTLFRIGWNECPDSLVKVGRNIHKTVKMITPSEYLSRFPEQHNIGNLWPGCWFSPDFATWIGEDEENQAWNYLRRTRTMLNDRRDTVSAQQLDAAMELMYIAEGSDWFWWYGADQSTADERAFDVQYRQTLMDIYQIMGEKVPDWLYAPIMLPPPPAPTPQRRRSR